MRHIAVGVLVLIALALGGCYGQGQAGRDANEFCHDHGGVAEVNYSAFDESGSWVCKDGEAGGN